MFNVDNRRLELEDQEQLSIDPTFWNDPERAESILRDLKINKNWVSQYEVVEACLNDLIVLDEFQKANEATEEEVNIQYEECVARIEEAEFKSTLNKEEDELNAILEINAGAGGTEACDWAEMLYRMYVLWGEKSGYKVKELHRVSGDVAGIKSAVLEIDGDYTYGMLKGENGVHRLVRISPFDSSNGRSLDITSSSILLSSPPSLVGIIYFA